MDTANDYRILLAEKGVDELKKTLQAVRVQKRKELAKVVENIATEVQVLKYSYLSPDELIEESKRVVELASTVLNAVKTAEDDFNKTHSEYWLEYLVSLPELFERGEIDRIGFAIRYFSGEIMTRSKISENLWLCSVDCGRRFDVVTNSEKLANSERVVVSHLPPRKFGNVVSLGMFVEAEFEKKGELSIEEIEKIADKLGEVESVLFSLIR